MFTAEIQTLHSWKAKGDNAYRLQTPANNFQEANLTMPEATMIEATKV